MSSKRAERRRGCEGKVRYADQQSAEWEMAVLKRLSPDDRLNVYRCKHCRHFHIGHMPGRILRGKIPRKQRR